jgi:hypothetical protein
MNAPELPAPPSAPAASGSLRLHISLVDYLIVPDGASRTAELRELSAPAAIYPTRAHGEGTRRAYRSAWGGFEAWCTSLGREPLAGDPDTLAMYAVRLAGIALDLRHPGLVMVLEGIARSTGTCPRKKAAAAGFDTLRLLLATRPAADAPVGVRDRALLLGSGGALRQSELAG